MDLPEIKFPAATSGHSSEWSEPQPYPGCPGWTLASKTSPASDLVAMLWKHGHIQITAVVNNGSPVPTEVTVNGETATLWPLCGKVFGSPVFVPPNLVDSTHADSYFIGHQNDHPRTHVGGSPRNSFRSYPQMVAAKAGGCSYALAVYLQEHSAFQFRRPYQDFDHSGKPRTLVPGAISRKTSLEPPHPSGKTIQAYCADHFTYGVLADGYLLTGNPLALHQLTLLLFHAIEHEYYWQPGRDYGRIARIAGWLLKALWRAVHVYRTALKRDPDSAATIKPILAMTEALCVQHTNRIAELCEDMWEWKATKSCFEPAVAGFHVAVLAFGLRCMTELRIPGATNAWLAVSGWLDEYAWDHKGGVYYEIAHDPKTDGPDLAKQEPGSKPTGVHTWLYAGLPDGSKLKALVYDHFKEHTRGVRPEHEWAHVFGLQGES